MLYYQRKVQHTKKKCRDILPEMEFILSQFKSYVEYGYINHDLLGISSSGFLYEQIPSLIGKKYVYPNEILNVPFFLYVFRSVGVRIYK